MTDALWLLGVVLFVVGLLRLMTWQGGKLLEARKQAFADAARKLGLALSAEDQPLALEGTLRGVPLRVEVARVQSGRRHRDVVRFTARPLRPLPTVIVRERQRAVLDAVPGHAEWRTGDQAFDAVFVVHAQNEAEAKALLDTELRAELLAGGHAAELAMFDASQIVLAFPVIDQTLFSLARIERTVQRLVALGGADGER
jgi:hypothetical protein